MPTIVLANHAHRAAPDGADTAAIAESASTWLTRAGERSMSLGSPEQALEQFEQALAIVSSGEGRAPLLEATAEAAARTGNLERAITLVQGAIGDYEAARDRDAVGAAKARYSSFLGGLDRMQDAATVAEQAYLELDEEADLRLRCKLALAVGRSLSTGIDVARGLEWAEIGLALSERLDDSLLLAQALFNRSFALFNLGRYREAVLLARGMVELAVEVGSLQDQVRATLGLSLYALPDDPHQTYTVAIESAEISRRAGMRREEETNMLNAAETGISLGLWNESRQILADLSTHFLRPQGESWSKCLSAMLLALTGETEAAMAMIEEHSELGDAESVANLTTMLHSQAMVQYASGDFEGAYEIAARAVAPDPMGINSAVAIALQARAAIWLKDQEGIRKSLAATELVHGRWMASVRGEVKAALAAMEGRPDDAGEMYLAAIESWRTLNCVLDIAVTELELIHLLGPEHPQAVTAKEAKDIFTQLGAVPYLERLEVASAT